jgi:hypothetical protein
LQGTRSVLVQYFFSVCSAFRHGNALFAEQILKQNCLTLNKVFFEPAAEHLIFGCVAPPAHRRLFPGLVNYCTLAEEYFADRCDYLHINKKHCTFALLIKKDGGIRPCEVLATCANKVLHSIPA